MEIASAVAVLLGGDVDLRRRFLAVFVLDAQDHDVETLRECVLGLPARGRCAVAEVPLDLFHLAAAARYQRLELNFVGRCAASVSNAPDPPLFFFLLAAPARYRRFELILGGRWPASGSTPPNRALRRPADLALLLF